MIVRLYIGGGQHWEIWSAKTSLRQEPWFANKTVLCIFFRDNLKEKQYHVVLEGKVSGKNERELSFGRSAGVDIMTSDDIDLWELKYQPRTGIVS